MSKEILLEPMEAALILDVQLRTLAAWRYRGTGPVYRKLGYRTVRYTKPDLDEWLAARRVVPKRRDSSESSAEID